MKNILSILFLVTSLCLNAQQEKQEIRKGNKEYNKGAYAESELHYRKALEKKPESEKANYNLANALYKQNQFEPAITKYETLTGNETNPVKLSSYYYNLGNAYFKSQKLDKCIEAYKQSLRLNPSDFDAKHNLLLAQNIQKQQQNQQKQNQDQKNKEDQKQDQKKDQDKNQQQDQKDQQKQQDKKDQQKNDQKQQISKQDAERLLEAMEQDEKNVMKKVQEQKVQVRKIPVEKEW